MKVSFKLIEVINRLKKKAKDLFHYFPINFARAISIHQLCVSPRQQYNLYKNSKKRGRFPIAAYGIWQVQVPLENVFVLWMYDDLFETKTSFHK